MSDSKYPSIAMTMCVRNEEEKIGANLAYHHALGVSRAYIFADRCTDATLEIAGSFPWVKILETPIDPPIDITTHQNKCAEEALQIARREGFDWLMHIDADEFAFADNKSFSILGKMAPPIQRTNRLPLLEKANLPAMLKKARRKTKIILMRTKEAIPLVFDEEQPFWKLHYFHNVGIGERKILDPVSGEIKQRSFLGHARGKTIVRTNADIRPLNQHQWAKNQGDIHPDIPPIPTEHKGWHYHFLFKSSVEWQKKYRKHSDFPDTWHTNKPVGFPIQSWKEASVRMSENEAQRYFNKWLAISQDELEKYLRKGTVFKETFVEDVLLECGWIP